DHGHRSHEHLSGWLLGIAGLFMVCRTLILACVASSLVARAGTVWAQSASPGGMPPPPGMSLAESAAMRFPQAVLVSALLHRPVLRPVESQDLIGRVRQVVRDSDGTVKIVIDLGGFLGFGSRPIAVPVDAMVLLGRDTEVVAYTP